MSYYISIVPVAPIRSDSSHRSEQVSQLLFGEVVFLFEYAKDFFKIKCIYDGYEGWCQSSQLAEIGDDQIQAESIKLVSEWSQQVLLNGQPMNIPLGSNLSLFTNGKFQCKHYEATFNPTEKNTAPHKYNIENIISFSHKFLNTPYLWGGKSVFGADCSGFCQTVFKFMNIYLHRDAFQQATQGESVGFLQEALCGDLAFFDNEEGRITHVGILLDAQRIMHASGKVRIDSIDNVGIINSDTGLRTHNLRIIKRMAAYMN